MRYALIEAEQIVNIIIWDGKAPYTPPAGQVAIPLNAEHADLGWVRQAGRVRPGVGQPDFPPKPDVPATPPGRT